MLVDHPDRHRRVAFDNLDHYLHGSFNNIARFMAGISPAVGSREGKAVIHRASRTG
jgi:hypothetical protein